jgi:hypothetical protein
MEWKTNLRYDDPTASLCSFLPKSCSFSDNDREILTQSFRLVFRYILNSLRIFNNIRTSDRANIMRFRQMQHNLNTLKQSAAATLGLISCTVTSCTLSSCTDAHLLRI